jgi:hypothetical protein
LENRKEGALKMDVSYKEAYAMNQKDEAGGDLPYLREHRRDGPKVVYLS